jgi:hypothetical protein
LYQLLRKHERHAARLVHSSTETRHHSLSPGPMLTPADHRPITLLNTDYKILAGILAWCLRPLLVLHLKAMQYCGVPGNTIFNAVATLRDVIAHAEHEKLPVCILTLDFQHVFDRLTHEYLFTILHNYGLSTHFVTLLRALYSEATSTVQINGHLHGPFPIHCGVRRVSVEYGLIYPLSPSFPH